MSETELYEKYHDKLPVFFVEDIYKEKYVDLERENNTENNSCLLYTSPSPRDCS